MFENFKKSHSLRDVIDKENINDSMTMSQSELQDHVRFLNILIYLIKKIFI
jgi:hypothetical protein